MEFHPDGSLVIKTTNTYVQAGDMEINCSGNFKVNAARIDLN